jgi:hypothetical protein
MDLPVELFNDKGFAKDPMSLLPVGSRYLAGIEIVEQDGKKEIKVLWIKTQGLTYKKKPKPEPDTKTIEQRNIVEEFEDIEIDEGGF